MIKVIPTNLFLKQLALVFVTALLCVSGNAQAPARTPYAAPGDWTVTTYRAGDSGEFLRCSAERHFDDGQTLTIAINGTGNLVLGFTSDKWIYEDRSTHPVSVRVDSGEETPLSGRVRILPVGPIVFVDLDPDSTVIAELSAGDTLYVSSSETNMVMDLTGSAAAIAGTNQCYADATD